MGEFADGSLADFDPLENGEIVHLVNEVGGRTEKGNELEEEGRRQHR